MMQGQDHKAIFIGWIIIILLGLLAGILVPNIMVRKKLKVDVNQETHEGVR